MVGDQDDRVGDNDDDGLHANDENYVDDDDKNSGRSTLTVWKDDRKDDVDELE